MKAKTIICPVCRAERKTLSEEDNMHEYIDENVSEVCYRLECMESAENRLLEAIFGRRVNKSG